MAKPKITEKKECGFLTRQQAVQVWESPKPKLDDMVKTGVKPREKFTSTGVLLDPKIWPVLAELFLMPGKPAETKLDYGKIADYFNEIIKKSNAGKLPEPKSLTAGDMRKLALDLTRKRLADAIKVLAKTPADAQALAKQKEAHEILARQGWEETPVKREKKEIGKTKKTAESAPDENQVQAPVNLAETAKVEPKGPAPAPTPEPTEPKRYYITGETKPVKEELKKLGAKWEGSILQWYLPSVESQTKAQKIVDDYQAGAK